MSLFDWFADRRKDQSVGKVTQEQDEGDGLWSKCSECGQVVYRKDIIANAHDSSNCGHHNRIDSAERIALIADPGSFTSINGELEPTDPLGFKDRRAYADRLRETQAKTGLRDAVITGTCRVMISHGPRGDGLSVHGGSIDPWGSASPAWLKSYRRAPAPADRLRVSGARTQRNAQLDANGEDFRALERHREQELLYMPLLTHPTTGGVTASFAAWGLILAEPKALIGFAGRRVIEQTLREKLLDDFQTAEYPQEKGFVDTIVPRTQLKSTLATLLRLHGSQPVGVAG